MSREQLDRLNAYLDAFSKVLNWADFVAASQGFPGHPYGAPDLGWVNMPYGPFPGPVAAVPPPPAPPWPAGQPEGSMAVWVWGRGPGPMGPMMPPPFWPAPGDLPSPPPPPFPVPPLPPPPCTGYYSTPAWGPQCPPLPAPQVSSPNSDGPTTGPVTAWTFPGQPEGCPTYAPAAAPCKQPVQFATVANVCEVRQECKIAAKDGIVFFTTANIEARCSKITYPGTGSRVVLEGDVHLVYKKGGQNVRIEGSRVIFDLSQGSFTIESGNAPTTVITVPRSSIVK